MRLGDQRFNVADLARRQRIAPDLCAAATRCFVRRRAKHQHCRHRYDRYSRPKKQSTLPVSFDDCPGKVLKRRIPRCYNSGSGLPRSLLGNPTRESHSSPPPHKSHQLTSGHSANHSRRRLLQCHPLIRIGSFARKSSQTLFSFPGCNQFTAVNSIKVRRKVMSISDDLQSLPLDGHTFNSLLAR